MRKPLTPAQQRLRDASFDTAGQSFEDFMGAAPAKKKRPTTIGRKAFDQHLSKTSELVNAQQWDKFTATNLVALYAILHNRVYTVLPLELLRDWRLVQLAAGGMVKREFDGDFTKAVKFLRWVWFRENRSYKRRSEDNDFRIGWRYLFKSPKLLTDYRISLSRQGRIK